MRKFNLREFIADITFEKGYTVEMGIKDVTEKTLQSGLILKNPKYKLNSDMPEEVYLLVYQFYSPHASHFWGIPEKAVDELYKKVKSSDGRI